MRMFCVVGVMVLAALCACANDAYVVGASGRVQRMDGEHATVRMVCEWVKMDVYPEFYDVAVQFVFHNDGPATTVRMGFPERGGGDIGAREYTSHTGFQHFRTWVDGRKVKAERLRSSREPDEMEYEAYWVKTVDFTRGQTRSVRVEYRSPIHASSLGDHWASYDFAGGNWAGTVEESTLRVTIHLPGAYLVDPGIPMTGQGNQLAFRWANWQAERGFQVSFAPVRADALIVRGVPPMPFTYFSEHSRIMAFPGKGPTPIVIPAAIDKGGVAFINLSLLADALRERAYKAERPREEYPTLTWEAGTQQATLTVAQRALRFRLKRPVMQINEREVPLPAGPFLSTPVERFGQQSSNLYVPIISLAEALGGAATLNLPERRVVMEIPNWWQATPNK